ncbi:hypothetical protein [Streptomyces sp. NPDC057910]|uniref:hypothetical protein n=1 Tax=Streptomyces sp. NPDC057910 TaxID=3346278 RepID=UPI0036E62230
MTELVFAEAVARGASPDGADQGLLLSFLARRISSHGFNEPTRTFSRQSAPEAASNLAYLLGLDWQLVDEYRQLAARKATRAWVRQLRADSGHGVG